MVKVGPKEYCGPMWDQVTLFVLSAQLIVIVKLNMDQLFTRQVACKLMFFDFVIPNTFHQFKKLYNFFLNLAMGC